MMNQHDEVQQGQCMKESIPNIPFVVEYIKPCCFCLLGMTFLLIFCGVFFSVLITLDTYEFRYNQESQCLVMYPRIACSEEVNQGQTCMALVCLQQTNTTWVSNYKDCPSIQIRTVLRYPQNTKFYNLTSGTNTTCFVNSMSKSSSFVSYTVNNQEKVVWKILSGLSWGLLGVVIAPLLLGCLVLMFRMKIPILKQKFTLKKQQSQMKHQHGEDSKEQEQLT